MELRQLTYFVAAAEKMNFTEAAKSCFITQSTLSQQIKLMEDEMGVPLFNRIGKRIENLTEAGAILLRYAQRILQQADEAKMALNELQQLATGELRIGVTYALSHALIKALASFTARYPKIHTYMEYGTSAVLEQKLRASQLDLILTFHIESDDDELIKQFLLTSRLMMAVSDQNALAGRKEVSIEELAEQEMVLPGNEFRTRRFIDKLFKQKGLKPRIRMELNDVRSTLELVVSSNWATIVTEQSLARNWPHLMGIPIKGEDGKVIIQHAYVIWQKEIYQKKAARILIEELIKQAKET
ncbi:LysR substrate-binding domain-containing protein [Olivibacter sitiensis]|uniref:LysR substrate-binding domain-containing protein n=1 Tax=Olivibacter sitiensis TaxID=376470 RepID=UPI0004064C55|nr:LysR substrate-binding domain-containing protein [Olivibacter sitiensis]